MTKIRANQVEIEELLNDPEAFASEIKKGSVEIATQAEINAGTAGILVATAETIFNRPSDILDMTAFSDGTTDSIISSKDSFTLTTTSTGLSIDTSTAIETGFNILGMGSQTGAVFLIGVGSPPYPNGGVGAGVHVSLDGTQIWFTTSTASDVYTAPLSTPFNITSMGAITTIPFIAGSSPLNLTLDPTGTVFMLQKSAGEIQQFSLNPAWDLTTMSLVGSNPTTGSPPVSIFNPADSDTDPVYFSRDGLRGYAGDRDRIGYSFTLSTAWDITSATKDAFELDMSAHSSSGSNMYISISEDGTKLFHHRFASPMEMWTLATPFELSSATWTQSQNFTASGPRMGSWSDGGLHYYITADDYIYQYDTGFGDGGSGVTSTSLYYDGVATLTTSADGVEVTGIIAFVAEGSPATTPQLVFANYATADLPSTTIEGGTVYDTDTKTLKFYNGSTWTTASTVALLSDLTDVVFGSPTPTLGDVLSYNGATWSATSSAVSLNELTDVTLTGSPAVAEGDVLIYDAGTWVNSTAISDNFYESLNTGDMDALTEKGIYTSDGFTNFPSETASLGTLLVSRNLSSSIGTQLYITTDAAYFREGSGGTFAWDVDWNRLALRTGGISPEISLKPVGINGFPAFVLEDTTATQRAKFQYDESNGELTISRLNTGSPFTETTMVFQTNGLIWVSDGTATTPTPTTDKQLANKKFVDDNDRLTINTQTGTTYTLVLSDENTLVTMSNAAANTLTIPTNASVAFPIGTQVLVEQEGVGTTTISGGVGSPPAVTIHSSGNIFDAASQYTTITLIKKATDTWLIVGDLV